MRLIKHRNGYSDTGRLAANWAQTSALAHTSKVLPGVLVRRNGDFTNIWKTEVDHFFITAGLVGDQLKLASSATARGTFSAFDGTEPVSYYGKGLGQQESRAQDGTLPAFNGSNVSAAVDSFYRTRTGRTAEFSYGVKHVLAPFDWLPGGGQQYGQIVTPSVGEVYLDPVTGNHRFVANVTTMTLVDGQYTPLYILDHDGEVTAGNVPFVANREAGHVDVRLLGRGARLMKHRYFRSVAADGTPVPGTFFSFSTNAGAQFTPMPSAGPMFDDLVAVQAWCDTFPTAAPRVRTHNFATANVAVTTCRISGPTAAVVARVPYLQLDVADPEAQEFLRGRVRLGRLDCATGVMTAEAVLYDGRVAIASLYVVTMIPVAGGALLLTRDPDDLLTGANVAPWRIRFTADGITLVDVAEMPKPGYQTGLPTAVSPTRLICPMWDGRHSLYQSDDRGATWVRRATLYEGGDEPTNTHGELFMEQFNSVAFLRKDGRAASAAPGAPWIHDSRLPAPA